MDDKPVDQNQPDGEQIDAEGKGNDAPGKIEDDFGKLFAESLEAPQEGEIIHGVVIQVLKDYIAVNIHRKSEGMLPLSDLSEEEQTALVPGDPLDVMVERYDSSQGFVLLSREKVLRVRMWDELQKAHEEGTPVSGKIISKVKGGYTVDIDGVKAFLPGSQVDLRPVRDTDSVIGLEGKFKVLKLSRKKANVVVSRRSHLEEERETGRKAILETIREGMIVEGKVKNITEYGVFMDLGGLDGLMHITDMSYGKVSRPSDICKVGDLFRVKVIRFDREKERISLGLKQMKADPWEDIDSRYRPGGRLSGRVTNTTRYGAFIELEEGVEGLLHVSEMSWSKRLRDPSEVMKVGDTVEVVILRLEKEHKKISLGFKQLLPNPWEQLRETHPEGSEVEGVVKNVTDFGVFVDIGGEIDGLVHISDLTWNQRVKHPGEILKKGDKIRAKVLKVDPHAQKFSLGIKHLEADPWDGVENRYRKGRAVTGTITRVADFGVFVELEEGVEGLVHISELAREKVDTPHSLYKAGDSVGALVLSVDRAGKKISLSIRAHEEGMERKDLESYMSRPSDPPENMTALGEALARAKMKANGE